MKRSTVRRKRKAAQQQTATPLGRAIDLHTHSLASDGSDTPAELVRSAAALGLRALALTDHDTLSGLDEAEAEAGKLGLRFIRGVEIAVNDTFGELHLLGLFMPEPSERMREALDVMRENRRARNRAMLDALAALDMPMSMEEVRMRSGGIAVGRPHIALTMLEKGYVTSRKEAFDRYLGWNAKAFVPRELLSAEEGVALLRDEGAIVALAHPCLQVGMTPQRLETLAAELKEMGITAIEAYHSMHSPEHTRLCVDIAARHSLLLTGGSDYHGANKEAISLGRGKGGLRVPVTVLEHLDAARAALGLP